MKLKVIFEDEHILVLDKPAGIVVTPADTIQNETISDILIGDFKINLDRGGVVHRLDKDTSGVLIVAKTEAALENLQRQFKERAVKKEYIALVHGWLEKEELVSGAIARNPGDREKFIVSNFENSKEAETVFKPVSSLKFKATDWEAIFGSFNSIQKRKLERSNYNQFTLVNCFPKTGRTHQIRVHLKHIGFSIVADEKYGGRKTVRLDRRWCPRQFLHALSLEVNHPVAGERLIFKSEIPEDLQKALSNLTDDLSSF